MSDSSESERDSAIPPERLEALVERALGGEMRPGVDPPAEASFMGRVRLVREAIALEASEFPRGVPAESVARAKSLAALLPGPGSTGVRAWWDRTIAAIAACIHDDLNAAAAVGLRRGGSVRQVSFEASVSGMSVLVDLEIERRTAPDRGAIRCQVSIDASETGLASVLTAAAVRDGVVVADAVVDRDGFFELEVPEGRCDLAIHLGEAGAVVLPDLEVP